MHPETEAHLAAAGVRSGQIQWTDELDDIIELTRHTAELPLPWLQGSDGPGALRAVQEAKQAGALPDHLL